MLRNAIDAALITLTPVAGLMAAAHLRQADIGAAAAPGAGAALDLTASEVAILTGIMAALVGAIGLLFRQLEQAREKSHQETIGVLTARIDGINAKLAGARQELEAERAFSRELSARQVTLLETVVLSNRDATMAHTQKLEEYLLWAKQRGGTDDELHARMAESLARIEVGYHEQQRLRRREQQRDQRDARDQEGGR